MFTAEMTELEELETIYCELHKDAYGVKARWYRAESVEQALKDIDSLQEEIQRVIADERERQADAAVKLEKTIVNLIASGAGNRETAIRWLHDSEDTGGDDAYLEYHLGVEYGYFKKTGK